MIPLKSIIPSFALPYRDYGVAGRQAYHPPPGKTRPAFVVTYREPKPAPGRRGYFALESLLADLYGVPVELMSDKDLAANRHLKQLLGRPERVLYG